MSLTETWISWCPNPVDTISETMDTEAAEAIAAVGWHEDWRTATIRICIPSQRSFCAGGRGAPTSTTPGEGAVRWGAGGALSPSPGIETGRRGGVGEASGRGVPRGRRGIDGGGGGVEEEGVAVAAAVARPGLEVDPVVPYHVPPRPRGGRCTGGWGPFHGSRTATGR